MIRRGECAKREMDKQDYDGNPPRCATCVYFKREPERMYIEREVHTRKGRIKTMQFRCPKNPIRNPTVDKCTFGNFQVKPHAVCNEWHSREGEKIAEFVKPLPDPPK